MFKTIYSGTDRHHCPSGSRIAKHFIKKCDEHGNGCLECIEEYDLQEQIDSYKDFCMIENIIKRYMGGDVTALNSNPGVFMNTLGMPNDIHQVHAYLAKAKDLYNNMPADLRGDHSFDSFVQSLGSRDGVDAFYKKVYARKQKTEVKRDES